MSQDDQSRRPLRQSNDRRPQDLPQVPPPPPPPTRDPRVRPATQGSLGNDSSPSNASYEHDQEKSVSSMASSHMSSDDPTTESTPGETLPMSFAFAVVASQTQQSTVAESLPQPIMMIADHKPPPAVEQHRASGVENAAATVSRPGIPLKLDECGKELEKEVAHYHAMVGDHFTLIQTAKVNIQQKLSDSEKKAAVLTATLRKRNKDIDTLHLRNKELEDRLQLVEARNATLRNDAESRKEAV
ncbi:hypothetical protein P7C70_g8781, partial [Phenoliferia sp. Uapishka_3]